MKKIILILTFFLSPSAWSLQDIYLGSGDSVILGNYRVNCEGQSGPLYDTLTRKFYYTSSFISCQKAAQFINGSMSHDNVRIQASCSNSLMTVRVSYLSYGQSARFRTDDIPLSYGRDLRDVLNSMNSSTLSASAQLTVLPNNPNYGYVGFAISK